MRHTVLALLMTAAVVLAGCSTDSSLDNPVTATSSLDKTTLETQTALQYVGYSRDGIVVVRGTLTLSVSTVGRVVGRWELRGADPARIGPQVGRGTLTGNLVDGILSINLNPQNADNNVLLSGRFSRTEYAGRWEWVGLRGVLNAGTFRAGRRGTVAEDFSD
jgi:hypothetical protein